MRIPTTKTALLLCALLSLSGCRKAEPAAQPAQTQGTQTQPAQGADSALTVRGTMTLGLGGKRQTSVHTGQSLIGRRIGVMLPGQWGAPATVLAETTLRQGPEGASWELTLPAPDASLLSAPQGLPPGAEACRDRVDRVDPKGARIGQTRFIAAFDHPGGRGEDHEALESAPGGFETLDSFKYTTPTGPEGAGVQATGLRLVYADQDVHIRLKMTCSEPGRTVVLDQDATLKAGWNLLENRTEAAAPPPPAGSQADAQGGHVTVSTTLRTAALETPVNLAPRH